MVQDAISQDLSELPDASFAPIGEDTLDQLADLPPIPTAGGRRTSRAPSLGLTSPRKASRAPSLGPLRSPRKGSRPSSRRNSRAPSVQPSAAALSADANGALDPTSSLAPNHGLVSRRTSRAPSLGPTVTNTTVITEEVTEASTVGATFSVPEGDSSLFLDQFDGLYPDLTQTGHNDF